MTLKQALEILNKYDGTEINDDLRLIGKVTKDKTVLNILEEVKKYDT